MISVCFLWLTFALSRHSPDNPVKTIPSLFFPTQIFQLDRKSIAIDTDSPDVYFFSLQGGLKKGFRKGKDQKLVGYFEGKPVLSSTICDPLQQLDTGHVLSYKPSLATTDLRCWHGITVQGVDRLVIVQGPTCFGAVDIRSTNDDYTINADGTDFDLLEDQPSSMTIFDLTRGRPILKEKVFLKETPYELLAFTEGHGTDHSLCSIDSKHFVCFACFSLPLPGNKSDVVEALALINLDKGSVYPIFTEPRPPAAPTSGPVPLVEFGGTEQSRSSIVYLKDQDMLVFSYHGLMGYVEKVSKYLNSPLDLAPN